MNPTAAAPQAADNIEEALGLYRELAEEMKYSVFAMQTLAQS